MASPTLAPSPLTLSPRIADYRARLVDPRKVAFVDACIAAATHGQPWPTPSDLRSDLAEQVRGKLRRYGLIEPLASSVQRKPTRVDDWIAAHPEIAQANAQTVAAEREPAKLVILRPCVTCGIETHRQPGAIMLHEGEHYCAACKLTRVPVRIPQVPTAAYAPTATEPEPIAARPFTRAGVSTKASRAVAQTADEPATVADDPIVVCGECQQAHRQSEAKSGKCPNPACWKGLKAYCAHTSAWEAARDSYVGAYRQAWSDSGIALNTSGVQASWEQRNPAPAMADYRDKPRTPQAREWEAFTPTPHCRNCGKFSDECARCAKAKESFFSRQPHTDVTRAHGHYSVLASRADEIAGKIAKAEKPTRGQFWFYAKNAKTGTPDPNGRMRVPMVTHTIGGEPWDQAVARMTRDAEPLGTSWRDANVPIPCSAREYSFLNHADLNVYLWSQDRDREILAKRAQ
ncbi:hypothetical protein AYO38_02580 [bacterium SCGC AG-212-C10]|nr:hypothetical protein AYO38_02580 [bacterium SCGC AG-212-C10]